MPPRSPSTARTPALRPRVHGARSFTTPRPFGFTISAGWQRSATAFALPPSVRIPGGRRSPLGLSLTDARPGPADLDEPDSCDVIAERVLPRSASRDTGLRTAAGVLTCTSRIL